MNHFIQGNEFRVLDEAGKQVGIMGKAEALQKAQELGVDVVEIAGKANPPVVKLISLSKFKYQLQQKRNEEKKRNKNAEIKELRLTPFIAKGDFDSRMKRARQFLEDGNKVRLVVKFKGRQITKKEFGDTVLNRAMTSLEDISTVEVPPKMMGKLIMMQLMPVKKKKEPSKELHEQKTETQRQTEKKPGRSKAV